MDATTTIPPDAPAAPDLLAAPDPPAAPAELSLGDLEDRLCRLAARIAAEECEFLELLAEFDARQGWGASGLKSSAHWLSWRTGMRLGVARERIRVARSLGSLPLVREAFAAGRLSYCKVRALSRVATAPTEPELVELALGATGAQLERIVRSWRTAMQPERSASSHIRRAWSRREDEDGSVIYTLRATPENAALVDAAVAAARLIVLDDDKPTETTEEATIAAAVGGDASTPTGPMRRAEADAVILIVESFLATGPQGSSGDATQVIVHADLDALDEETERARTTTERLVGTATEQRARATAPSGCRTENGQSLSASSVLRMLCSSPSQLMVHAADGRPLDLGRSRRHASKRQRRALQSRDGGCRFPGCTQHHRLIPHHVAWWTRDKGPTDMDNLILVCPTHHRAVHELGYVIVPLGAGRFTFHRPDGSVIPDAGAPAVDTGGELTETVVTATTIVPTWGGERLDLDHIIGGLAANALARADHPLADIPFSDLDPALRSAVQWPDPPTPPPWMVAPAA